MYVLPSHSIKTMKGMMNKSGCKKSDNLKNNNLKSRATIIAAPILDKKLNFNVIIFFVLINEKIDTQMKPKIQIE